MSIEINLFSIVGILAFSIALLLGILFVLNRMQNRKANYFMGFFLLSLALEVFELLFEDVFMQHNLNLKMIQSSLLTFPLLYFYVKQSINLPRRGFEYILFAPVVVTNLFWFYRTGSDFPEVIKYFEYIFNSGLLVYILLLVKEHRRNLANYYSEFEHKTMGWIKTIVYIFLGFHMFWLLEDLIVFKFESLLVYFAFVSQLLTLFTIIWIGHFGFTQPEIFNTMHFQNLLENSGGTESENENSAFDSELFQSIEETILNEKLFVNAELNLRMLSDQLHIKEKELSRLINQNTDANFYAFINSLRLEEFKRLLKSEKSEQLSILGLAMEAGFKSKSSFYEFFKKSEGITPNQYKQSLQ